MIDSIKGICCLAVILIHYNFPGAPGIYVKTACRFAVPYFFFVSGFFIVSETRKCIDAKAILGKIRHILLLTIGAGLFYGIFFVVWNHLMTSNFNIKEYLSQNISVATIIKLLVTNDPIEYSHLWFLLALLYCYIIILFFHGKHVSKWLIIPAVGLMLGFTFISQLNFLWGGRSSLLIKGSDQRIYLYNLFVFRALSFILLGMGLRQTEILIRTKLKESKLGIYLLCIVLGTGLAFVERTLFNESQFYLGTYIVFMALCLLSIVHPSSGNRVLEFIGKNLSMYIYIIHIAVGKSYDLIAAKFHLFGNPIYYYTRAAITIMFSLLFAYIIYIVVDFFKNVKIRKISAQ